MSDLFDTLQERYLALVARKEKDETGEELLEDVRAFIADARRAGAVTADVNERSQLRAWMRFLANVLYEATGVYPDTSLQPLAHGELIDSRLERREKAAPSSPLAWILIGGAAVIIIAVGLLFITRLSWTPIGPTPTVAPHPSPVPTPVLPVVSELVMGTPLDATGTVKIPADTFCLGTTEIEARFTLDNFQPGTELRWELQRDERKMEAQTTAPTGKEHQLVNVTISDPEPGRYTLLLYADGRVIGRGSFRVLDMPPRVFNLQVSDVPRPTGAATDRNTLPAGLRVIYLNYEYEGLCPGLDLSYTLYHDGKPLQEIQESWSGSPQGQAQVSFQPPDGQPFPPGDYELAVKIGHEEQGRVAVTIGETPQVRPAFGPITIALGVHPDGTPFLIAPDNTFDWNTKVVYGVFSYEGMSDGLRWSVLWTRNGQEVTREEHRWDVERDGTAGTYWVSHHSELGRTLPGGNYSVTLYIENAAQQTADFNVRYYVP